MNRTQNASPCHSCNGFCMGRVCCLGETESQTDICLHTATWPAGMYIVQLQTPKAIYNLKFIIK